MATPELDFDGNARETEQKTKDEYEIMATPELDFDDLLILKPAGVFIKLLAYQVEFILSCILSLSSPFVSIAFESIHRAEVAKENTEETVSAVPAWGVTLLKKLGIGLLGAAYVGLILVALMVFSVMVGVCLVRVWVEEPVFLRESVHFDYTDVHPTAVFSFQGNRKECVIPVGHTLYVSLFMLLPESDFNRNVGVFQVTAEVISAKGTISAKSSQPCMLRFRSLPIRLMHTAVISIPLLLGISDETQTITVPLLKHKEGIPRTEAIRARLVPRAGTSALPQIYSAEIIMNSELPWSKKLVYNWKWTFYVWTSLYVYIMCLIALVCCCKPILFPARTTMTHGVPNLRNRGVQPIEIAGETKVGREAYESLRNWQPRRRGRSRSMRKEFFPHEDVSETVGSSSFNTLIRGEATPLLSRDEASEVIEDSGGFTDGESVCQGG